MLFLQIPCLSSHTLQRSWRSGIGHACLHSSASAAIVPILLPEQAARTCLLVAHFTKHMGHLGVGPPPFLDSCSVQLGISNRLPFSFFSHIQRPAVLCSLYSIHHAPFLMARMLSPCLSSNASASNPVPLLVPCDSTALYLPG